MKRKTAHNESKSIKTFLLYTACVVVVILIALCVKAYFVFQQSTFDGESAYTLALTKTDRVEEIIAFHPATSSVNILKIKDTQIPAASLGKFLAVIPDAFIQVPSDFTTSSGVSQMLWQLGWRYNFIQSEATLVDIVRLGLFTKDVSMGNKRVEERAFTKEQIAQEKDIDKLVSDVFMDSQLSTENVSIQIVNASSVGGMGSRLERVLTNMGANVVSLSTARTDEQNSKIQYNGKQSYTLKKVQGLLDFPVSLLDRDAVAAVVIILGKDSVNTTKF